MKNRPRNFCFLAASLSACTIVSAVDQNGDQISDVYAQHYGLAAGSGEENPDHDEHNNYIESVWGTDPFDSESVFKPTSIQITNSVFDLAIPTVAGKRYQFRGTPTLEAGNWIDVDLPFTGTGVVEHMLTVLPISGTEMFFWTVRAVLPLDEDSDGLDAFEELLLGTSDAAADSDGDTVSDLNEFLSGLNPALNLDADGDGLPDDWELFHGAYNPSGDNDGDGWTNLEEFADGEDPNELNAEIAPPTLIVGGDYTKSGTNYTVQDEGDLSLYLRSAALVGQTHYLVEAPHLSPYLRFNGNSSSPQSMAADAGTYDPQAGNAAILKIKNGRYTIRAKTYLEVGGNTYESDEVEFTVNVEPLPRSGLPSGVKYINTAYYNPETGYFYDFSFDVPQHLNRQTCSGWLVEPESTFSPDYWEGFIPDLTSNSVNVYAGYGKPRVFSENSISVFWGTETVVSYGIGWAAGNQLYCDFSSVSSRKRYYGDSKNGWISDNQSDVNNLWEEDLHWGWMTSDGFIPDQSSTIYADDIYYDDERGRLTTSLPQGLDNDEDLGEGWIGG